MISIASDILKTIIGDKLTQEVEDVDYRTKNLATIMEDTASTITSNLLIFTSTINILSDITDFKSNTDNYVLRLDKSYLDNSNFLESLKSFFEDYPLFQENDSILNALDIETYTDVESLKCVPSSFIDWMGDILLKSIISRVYENYPYPEFLLGTNLAIIYFNALSFNMKNDIPKCQQLVQDLLTIDVDAGEYLDDAYLNLNTLYLNSSVEINYSLFSSYMSSADMNHIRQIVKACVLVLNNSVTNLSKVFKNFQLPSFVKYIS